MDLILWLPFWGVLLIAANHTQKRKPFRAGLVYAVVVLTIWYYMWSSGR